MDNEQKLLSYLITGKRITTLEAPRLIGTLELRVYVSKLRRGCYNIKDRWVTADNGKRFKEYWLEPNVPIATSNNYRSLSQGE